MVQVEFNGDDVQYVWCRYIEVNGEDVQYVWCRERLTERMDSMCGAGRG